MPFDEIMSLVISPSLDRHVHLSLLTTQICMPFCEVVDMSISSSLDGIFYHFFSKFGYIYFSDCQSSCGPHPCCEGVQSLFCRSGLHQISYLFVL